MTIRTREFEQERGEGQEREGWDREEQEIESIENENQMFVKVWFKMSSFIHQGLDLSATIPSWPFWYINSKHDVMAVSLVMQFLLHPYLGIITPQQVDSG